MSLTDERVRQLRRLVIRTDGSHEQLGEPVKLDAVARMIGARGFDTVGLHHLGRPLLVMLVDDQGYDAVFIEHNPTHYETRPVKATKPVNEEATRLYHANCWAGTTHQIVGDVVVLPDSDFLDDD